MLHKDSLELCIVIDGGGIVRITIELEANGSSMGLLKMPSSKNNLSIMPSFMHASVILFPTRIHLSLPSFPVCVALVTIECVAGSISYKVSDK